MVFRWPFPGFRSKLPTKTRAGGMGLAGQDARSAEGPESSLKGSCRAPVKEFGVPFGLIEGRFRADVIR